MEELNKKVIELYQEMARGQGLTDSLMIEIFARLYISPEPVAMDDLAKETGYSLASISNKVKAIAIPLQIKRIRKPGTKKLFLYMEKDIMKIFKDALLKKEEFVVNITKEKLPKIIKEYKDKAKSGKDKEKLKIIESYYEQILKFETILGKILKEFEKIQG